VPPVKYELGLYIPEHAILHSHCRENLKSYITSTVRTVTAKRLCLSGHVASLGTKEKSTEF
jgi:hypothetical protein